MWAGRARPLRQADLILVFGAAVWGHGPSQTLEARLARAADVFAEGWAPRVLCSGGWSRGRSEAAVMRRVLVERGVPRDVIVADDRGATTRDAIGSARRLVDGRQALVLAVSSPYHMRRIQSEARRQGLAMLPCPAPRRGKRTRRMHYHDLRQHVRELVALPVYAACAGWSR